MKTAIVILNYNNYEDTFNCIKSIEKFNSADIKYIVVDNASPRDGVLPNLKKFLADKFYDDFEYYEATDQNTGCLPKASLISSKVNNGYAQGNNIGLNFAYRDSDIDYVLIINNDVLFIADIIPRLVDYESKLSNCGLISPVLYKRDLKGFDYNCARTRMTLRQILLRNISMGKPWFGIKKKIDEEQYMLLNNPELFNEEIVKTEIPSGSCMLASKETWQKINSFDPNTFLYFEEAILFEKTKKEGLQNYLIPSLRCIHLGASSTSKTKQTAKSYQLSMRSEKYYLDNYYKTNALGRFLIYLTFVYQKIGVFVRFRLLKH